MDVRFVAPRIWLRMDKNTHNSIQRYTTPNKGSFTKDKTKMCLFTTRIYLMEKEDRATK